MTTERAFRMTARVGPGHRVELILPESSEGDQVEIFVVPGGKVPEKSESFLDLVDSFPPGPRSAESWAEVEANLQADRNSWNQ